MNVPTNSLLYQLLSADREGSQSPKSPPGLPEARIATMREFLVRSQKAYEPGDLVTAVRGSIISEDLVGEPMIVLERRAVGCDCHPERRYLVGIIGHHGDFTSSWFPSYAFEPYTGEDSEGA